MEEFPTVLDSKQCSISTCDENTKCTIPVPYITLHISNGNLKSIEDDVKKRLLVEKSSCHYIDEEGNKCRGLKKIQPSISSMHLFIELLNWEGT